MLGVKYAKKSDTYTVRHLTSLLRNTHVRTLVCKLALEGEWDEHLRT